MYFYALGLNFAVKYYHFLLLNDIYIVQYLKQIYIFIYKEYMYRGGYTNTENFIDKLNILIFLFLYNN